MVTTHWQHLQKGQLCPRPSKAKLKRLSCPAKNQAYISLVRPILEYSCIIWDPHLQCDIDKLKKVQRRAARFVCNDYDRHSSVSMMLAQLNWATLQERRKHHRLTFLHKIFNNKVAVPADLFTINQRPQRHAHHLHLKHEACNTNVYKFSFVPRTILDWNSLTDSVVASTSTEQFKSALERNVD